MLVSDRCVPLTIALTPVDALTPLTAAAMALTVVPLAKLSCSVPSLPATSSVTPCRASDGAAGVTEVGRSGRW